MKPTTLTVAAGLTVGASVAVLCAATGARAGDFTDALAASKPLIDSNLRLEEVDQHGIARKAEALTLRNRIGWQTGEFHHLSALVEIANIAVIDGQYNSTVNGKTQYPGVNDPNVTELNRAQVTWTPVKGTSVTAGRQRIILDDARFVGNAGWRQDEQTFDGVRFDTGTGHFRMTAAWLTRVNRVIGDLKDWHSNSYLLNGSYDVAPELKLTGFAYSLRFTTAAFSATTADAANARASSVDITGLRAAGSHKTTSGNIGYVLQYAEETDGHGNPQTFRLHESMVEVNGTWKMWTGRLNYESLGGNGTVGFVSPLASPHPFDGFADAFSATGGNKTFVDGLNDLNATLTFNLPVKHKTALTAVWHDFDTVRQSRAIGTEWDAVATIALTPQLSLMLKHADFHKDNGNPTAPASRTKSWIMLSYKL